MAGREHPSVSVHLDSSAENDSCIDANTSDSRFRIWTLLRFGLLNTLRLMKYPTASANLVRSDPAWGVPRNMIPLVDLKIQYSCSVKPLSDEAKRA
jgi:hypothetical protein